MKNSKPGAKRTRVRKPAGNATNTERTVSELDNNSRSIDHKSADAERVVLDTLRCICIDPQAPAAARASAARTLAEILGMVGRNQEPPKKTADKAAHAMTREELDAEIARLSGEL